MKKLRKVLQLFCFLLFVLLAASGIGISNALFANKERYSDTEIRIELVDKKEEDEESVEDEQ